MGYRFAIIGGGLTATSMVCQLVDKLGDRQGEDRRIVNDLSIDLFEKQDMVGPGTVHNGRFTLPFHITNMCAGDMSVRIGRPDEFQTWALDNGASLAEQFPELADFFSGTENERGRCHHYPRAIMGEYLKSQIECVSRMAQRLGLKLSLHANCEVDDLDERDGRIYLSINSSLKSHERAGPFDGVLMATGHWAGPAEHEHYFSSPWPAAELLRKIPPGASVGVLGSSLSAIEVTLTLSSDGRFTRRPGGELAYLPSDSPRKLTLYSRRGLLPRVRGRIGSRRNRWLNVERLRNVIAARPCRLTLVAIFELLDKELTEACGGRIDWYQLMKPEKEAAALLEADLARSQKGDGPDKELIWQTVLVQIFPVVRELYLNLEPGERERFDRDFSTHFFRHAATQPAVNGEKLLALMKAGIVSVVRLGNDYRLAAGTGTGDFEIICRGSGGMLCRDSFTYCVDARGQTRSVESDPSPLIKNLLKKEIIELEHRSVAKSERSEGDQVFKTGSMLIDPETHRVIKSDELRANGNSQARGGIDLFAVGAMTRGQIIDSSMAYGLARSTANIADYVIAELTR